MGLRNSLRIILSVFFATLFIFMAIQAGITSAQEGTGGFGVEGTTPTFLGISVIETNELIFVNASVFSLNGCSAISYVNVTVEDDQGGTISMVSLNFNMTSVGSPRVTWTELAGSYFNNDERSYEIWWVPPYSPEISIVPTGLNVSFAYEKFSGNSIRIICADKYQRTTEYNGPFSSKYTPKPVFTAAVIPIGLSAMVGLVAAVIMAFRRHSNNKLAKSVEASQLASGKD